MRPLYGNAQPGDPVALNASSTYGVDDSVGNNFGLGRSFVPQRYHATLAKQEDAKPSLLWLIGGIILACVVL